jgi:ABC-type antimicrobial peptide transport system permease subunit
MVLRSGLATGIVGIVVGVFVSTWVSSLVSSFLFGLEPWDPLTYAAVTSLLLLVCLVASYLPARRITSVDPVEVLRSE